MVVYAQTEPGSGARGIAAFVVDGTRQGFVRGAPADTNAARGIDTGGFRLQAYRARADELLHPPGQAFKAALTSINGARTYVAAMCCGMVDECLQAARTFGSQRRTFGKSLHEHQGWRWSLADAAIDLEAARLLVGAAADLIDAGRDAQAAAAKAKVFATRMAGRHIAALLTRWAPRACASTTRSCATWRQRRRPNWSTARPKCCSNAWPGTCARREPAPGRASTDGPRLIITNNMTGQAHDTRIPD